MSFCWLMRAICNILVQYLIKLHTQIQLYKTDRLFLTQICFYVGSMITQEFEGGSCGYVKDGYVRSEVAKERYFLPSIALAR
uniref:Uncharacterized protein n=1 Tax=Magnetococcus massalia (strain MO-1) TaxID=451514 RepID=A0A1S7LD46_MAGMO|nr:protein of unknown function [Candidatus Magnetococcus massalia]